MSLEPEYSDYNLHTLMGKRLLGKYEGDYCEVMMINKVGGNFFKFKIITSFEETEEWIPRSNVYLSDKKIDEGLCLIQEITEKDKPTHYFE